MSTNSIKPRTKRRGLPKTRLGCRICKKRHVKCGEEKPVCLRCTSFGVQCDGYDQDRPNCERKTWTVMAQRKPLLLPKVVSPPLAKNPCESLFCAEKDHHYFEVFCTKTAFQILPYYDAGIFRQMLLQACVSDDALRHAVVALGAMDMKMETLDEFKSLSLDDQDRSSHLHHLNALKEYSVAISKMRAASLGGKSNIRIALLTSLMILCFEAWNGNLDFAVRQIQTGLRLIREWHESAKGLLSGPIGSDPAYSGSLEGELVRIFSRLDTQIVSFSEKPSPEYHAMIIARGRKVLERMPLVFTSLSEASVFEEAIIRRGMAFVCHEIPLVKPPPPLHTFPMNGWWGCREPKVLATLESMTADSMCWRIAFAPLWTRLKEENNPSDLFPAALMRNRIVSAHLGCTVPTVANEEDFDHYLEEFKVMVAMSEYMLGTLDTNGEKIQEAKKPKSPKFNFDSYTVIPMFLTALKCRDPVLRRKAITLLLKYPRREGVCDSVCMGKLCEWAMKIEEEHIEDGRVPAWARVHNVTLDKDWEKENSGTLMCEQRVSASSDEVVIKSTHMTWNFSELLANTANAQSEYLMGYDFHGTI